MYIYIYIYIYIFYIDKSITKIITNMENFRTHFTQIIGSESNLGNDHEFTSKGIHLHWYEPFCESPKHERLYSKWTISYNCGES